MTPELVQDAKQALEDLLTFFGVNTTVQASAGEEDSILLSVDSDLSGFLIGHRGDTLAALQHLVNMIMRAKTRERVYVHIDIGGYRAARLERLEAKAQEIADRVESSGQEVVLPPMNPAERRHVHSLLSERSGVTTESRGEGNHRRLVIKKA
jgi:spoIIIJ-associated protein